jgi:cell division protein FtsB
MAIDWRFYLASPLRAARRALPPLGLFAIAIYFALNGIYGERGYLSTDKKQAALQDAEVELALLQEERMALELRVDLLNGRAIGRDLLEEEARRVLSVAHEDEVIVQMPRVVKP